MIFNCSYKCIVSNHLLLMKRYITVLNSYCSRYTFSNMHIIVIIRGYAVNKGYVRTIRYDTA